MAAIAHLTQEELILRSGKFNVRNGYLRSLLNSRDTSPGKEVARDKVIDLFMENCTFSKDQPLRMITLPGPQWKVEQELYRLTEKRAHFTAFENVLPLMNKGMVNVPRPQEGKRRMVERKNFVPLDVSYFRTPAARWLNVDFKDWCTLEPKHMKHCPISQEDTYDYWLRKFWSYNCAWLDFCCQLGGKMDMALSRFPLLQGHDFDDNKAIAVTVLKGRELPETTRLLSDLQMTRAEYIAFLLDRKPGHYFSAHMDYEYVSQSEETKGSPMLLVTGVWKRNETFTPKPKKKHDRPAGNH
jgi:hypothetical protein